jgi:hypothetical protein
MLGVYRESQNDRKDDSYGSLAVLQAAGLREVETTAGEAWATSGASAWQGRK